MIISPKRPRIINCTPIITIKTERYRNGFPVISLSLSIFKTITSITFPANIESGGFAATWDVGVTGALGLNYCMDEDTVLFATLNGTYESTRATVTYDADEIEKNTADLNSALDGNDVNVYHIQNFRCFP